MARTERSDQRARDAFLERLAETCCVVRAAAHAGIERRRLYEMRAADPEFAAAWTRALEAGSDILESEALRRSVEGVDEPVYQGGALVGSVTKYSDTLLALLLKSHLPEKYRERSEVKHSGTIELANALEAARKRVTK
jgi:hypothetical protein